MSKPVTITNAFATQTGPIPLSQLDTDFNALATSVNDMGTYSNYLVDSSGSANQITCTAAVGLAFAYTAGMSIQVKLANTNTSGTVNINVNALGNVPVIYNDGLTPIVGALLAGSILSMIYDGSNFRLTSKSSSLSVHRTTNGTVVNNDTLVADSVLKLTLTPGTWVVEIGGNIGQSVNGSAPGFNTGIYFTGGTYTAGMGIAGLCSCTPAGANGGGIGGASFNINNGVGPNSFSQSLNTTTQYTVWLKAALTVTATGTVGLMWSQLINTTDTTTLFAGSYITAQQIS